MKCLIIASGEGKRLRTRGDSKPLTPLLGTPLIDRVILTAKKAGITDFYIVIGYKAKEVQKHLEKLSRKRDIKITCILNNEWNKENGISVLKAKNALKENFLLLMSDHIFNEGILKKLLRKKIDSNQIILAVDYNIKNTLVDTKDATKVLIKNNKVIDIGKNIDKYNAFDTGIFLCTPIIFRAIEEGIQRGDTSLTGGIKVLAEKRKAKVFDIKSDYWIDVDNEDMFKKAEKHLLSTLKKPSDGVISRYINRPMSARITKQLVKTNITPNIISFLSFILCCIAASMFLLKGYIYLALGGILAQLASIIDGSDGEVARLKFQETDFGAWFDAVLDRYGDAFLLISLTYHTMYYLDGKDIPLLFGFLAIIGTFMNSYTADKYDGFMRKKIPLEREYIRLGRDTRIFIIFLLAIINQPIIAIVLIAVSMNIENVRRIIILYRREKEEHTTGGNCG